MKKLVAVLLVLMLVAPSCFAESDLSKIRVGVEFGMSMNEVKRQEQQNGIRLILEELPKNSSDNGWLNYYLENWCSEDPTLLLYRFDTFNRLDLISFSSDVCDVVAYDTLSKSIVEIFGDADYSNITNSIAPVEYLCSPLVFNYAKGNDMSQYTHSEWVLDDFAISIYMREYEKNDYNQIAKIHMECIPR